MRLPTIAVLALLVWGCGKSEESDKESKLLEPKPLADANAKFRRDGATYSSLGVCTPVWVDRISAATHVEAFADHDLTVTFTLDDASDVQAALYGDSACKTKISDDIGAPSGSGLADPTTQVKGDVVMKAGATSVAAYVLAESNGDTPSGKFDGGVSFGARYPEGYASENDTSALWFSPSSAAKDGLPVEILNMGKGTGLPAGACGRVTVRQDMGDEIIVVSKSDLSVEIKVSDTTNANAYTDSLCTQAATSLVLPAGRQDVALFFKTTTSEEITLTLTTSAGSKAYYFRGEDPATAY